MTLETVLSSLGNLIAVLFGTFMLQYYSYNFITFSLLLFLPFAGQALAIIANIIVVPVFIFTVAGEFKTFGIILFLLLFISSILGVWMASRFFKD